MFASRVSRLIVSSLLAGAVLIGCKGHNNTTTIPQALTNWVWESGSNVANSLGYYPTPVGTVLSISQPAARYDAMSWWNQSTHQLWVFSGTGGVSDVWQYSTASLQWTWMAGNASTSPQSSGSYPFHVGETGAPYYPGQRSGGSSWIDSAGNLWLFGGYGNDSTGVSGLMNDMWSYSPATNWWTWQGPVGTQYAGTGPNSALANYGTVGVPAATNIPGPRNGAATWTAGGVFYMFGGSTNPGGVTGVQNDLWSYNPTTQVWTWINGSQELNAVGSYQNRGQASSLSQPGSRQNATTWLDSTGNFWLFGGTGIDSQGNVGYLNDVWEYNPTTNLWTWMSGSPLINAIGAYGTNNTASTANYPGGRYGAIGWIDASNNLWVFGGYGINYNGSVVSLNDLWKFTPSTGTWEWVNGSYVGNVPGYYGTAGLNSTQNIPGSRYAASSFVDTTTGNFWMFGGAGYDAVGTNGRLSDVWQFNPN